MPNFYTPLVPDTMYHVLSRAAGNEKLFIGDNKYKVFLDKYTKYILPVVDTFAFCLLPNHFHFLIRIKPLKGIEEYLMMKKNVEFLASNRVSDMITECLSNFLNSYTKSFNKVCQRKGGLFIDYLKRVEIIDNSQFGSTIFYTHKNSVHHGW